MTHMPRSQQVTHPTPLNVRLSLIQFIVLTVDVCVCLLCDGTSAHIQKTYAKHTLILHCFARVQSAHRMAGGRSNN